MTEYICNKANSCIACYSCTHAEPHEQSKFETTVCTKWEECVMNAEIPQKKQKVRCVKVKS